MARQYFIKSNTGEWLALSGAEFYEFTKTEEGKSRYFMDFQDYMLEVPKAKYEEWKGEINHSDYVRRENTKIGYDVVSLYSDFICEHGNGEDVISDGDEDIETTLFNRIRKEALMWALKELDETEIFLIRELYLNNTPLKERELALKMGVSQKAINKRKNKILKKLNFLVLKFEKSQQ